MEDEDLAATVRAAFEVGETHISTVERLIAIYRAQHDEAKAVELEQHLVGLRQNLAQRREAWVRIKRREQ